MGKKERIQKELDLILEKLRFWRFVIVSIIAGILGLWIKREVDTTTAIIVCMGLIGIIFAIIRINTLTNLYYNLLDDLEKEE